jgi:outer membrane protein assembly factor BamA
MIGNQTMARTKAKNYFVIIDSIEVTGNVHSKRFVIEKELLFKKDSIYRLGDLNEMAYDSKNLLLNTNLFITTDVTWKEVRYQHIHVQVTVTEKWYIWPIPKFNLADRNYKQWADLGYKMNRTNYGIQWRTYNFRGRNETVKINLINGYTQNFALTYTVPFLEKSGKLGLDFNTSYTQNREIWYLTRDNHLQFYKNYDHVLIKRWLNNVALTTRRTNFATERIELEYNLITLHDTISSKSLNPNYLVQGNRQQEFTVRHVLHYEKRDNKYYPLEGFYARNELSLSSLKGDSGSVEMVRESLEAGYYKPVSKRFFVSVYGKVRYTNQPEPYLPYFNYKAFGYNDYVRGYEQYVIDGYAFGLVKTNLKFALLNRYLVKIPIKINKKHPYIPFGIFLNLYCDYGKVSGNQWRSIEYSYNNNLIGKDLLGYGPGLDFVLMNDKILRMEYSYNSLGDKNFNLHFKKAF